MADRMFSYDETASVATNGTSSSMSHLAISPPNLTDRFASYIECKRELEVENSRLLAALKSSKESYEREKVTTKGPFDDKLEHMRKSLDEVTVETAKLAIYHTRALADNDNLKCELEKVRQQHQESQKNLKNEVIARVELENNVQRLREELALQERLHNEEMNESRRQAETFEITSSFDEQSSIQESLEEVRYQCGDQIRSNRNELKLLVDGTMRKERNYLQREIKSLNSALECSFDRNDLIQIRIEELEKLNAASNVRINHLEFALEGERARSTDSETELITVRKEMDLLITKRQDLMDENLKLSLELAAFNNVLSNEHPCFEPGAKRPRKDAGRITNCTVTSTSTGNIEIVEADSAGTFIKLRNKGANEVVVLGGWKLIRHVDGNETIYEFGPTVQVNATVDLTVWSADGGASASPGDVLTAQKWIAGEEMKMTLVNGSGKEEAERVLKMLPTRHYEIRQPNAGAENNGLKCVVM